MCDTEHACMGGCSSIFLPGGYHAPLRPPLFALPAQSLFFKSSLLSQLPCPPTKVMALSSNLPSVFAAATRSHSSAHPLLSLAPPPLHSRSPNIPRVLRRPRCLHLTNFLRTLHWNLCRDDQMVRRPANNVISNLTKPDVSTHGWVCANGKDEYQALSLTVPLYCCRWLWSHL